MSTEFSESDCTGCESLVGNVEGVTWESDKTECELLVGDAEEDLRESDNMGCESLVGQLRSSAITSADELDGSEFIAVEFNISITSKVVWGSVKAGELNDGVGPRNWVKIF